MNQLTMVLDELDDRRSNDYASSLSLDNVQKLIIALRSEGGEMARIASVIEALAQSGATPSTMPHMTCPIGNVRMPENRLDSRTRTAGNGVMTGTGMERKGLS